MCMIIKLIRLMKIIYIIYIYIWTRNSTATLIAKLNVKKKTSVKKKKLERRDHYIFAVKGDLVYRQVVKEFLILING